MIKQLIADARKIIIKIGSKTLAGADGKINPDFFDEFTGQVAALMKKGKQVVIVSSGAQLAGISTMDKWARKKDIHYRQALCAVGQVELMNAWRLAFEKNGLHVGQILLTREDFSDPNRTLNMRNTLFTLVDEGVIPIINENDSVSVEEIKIGENDTLAARSAILWSADLLVLLSDEDGLYEKNPKDDPQAALVEVVNDIDAISKNITIGDANTYGTGGIATKLDAAKLALSYSIPTILAHGGKERCLENLAAGAQKATAFLAKIDGRQ